ncbi:acyl-CoA N-acyltransferase [Testicularia cyperi]|uniref:Acyl-CoA N-acyltransferase n=1 Tax=Testicularia cyperi TaxID=1882483 RepID=A0A317XPH4_9BASI|nr:acyl-CoA N-acyltransferase [Testicularia cyperi]
MSSREEELLARLGPEVTTPTPTYPDRVKLQGQYVDLLPLTPEHADELFQLAGKTEHEKTWDYLLEAPFDGDRAAFDAFIADISVRTNMVFWVVVDKATGRVNGYLSYLRIEPLHQCIEIGNILFSHLLQRTRKSTEAVYLLLHHALDTLGYRRVEWKCNNLNKPSKSAAVRFGFTHEGIFRKHLIIKGRNRDTCWFSIIDDDWPHRKAALQAWLHPSNFDDNANQIHDLKHFHALHGHTVQPPP